MGCFLKNTEGIYLKDIDSANGTIEFTPDKMEAKPYAGGDWFADTELEYVKFHFKEREEVKTLQVVHE